jgi:hypothetical protein
MVGPTVPYWRQDYQSDGRCFFNIFCTGLLLKLFKGYIQKAHSESCTGVPNLQYFLEKVLTHFKFLV